MRIKWNWALIPVILLISVLALMGCNREATETRAAALDVAGGDSMAAVNAILARFPISYDNPNPPIRGGTLRIAAGGGAGGVTFSGLMDPLFSTAAIDSDAQAFMRGTALFTADPGGLRIGRDGMATIDDWDHPTRSILINMNHTVYWHDGVQVTLDDLVFAYEVISNPDYTGIRWTSFVWNVVGTREFRAGERDHISGLELSPNKMSLRVYFTEEGWTPALEYFGFWTTISPRHHLEHIPVATMAQHINVRDNALGWGPFIMVSNVPGESYLFRANDNHWLGRPHVDFVEFTLIPPASIPLVAQAGTYDVIVGFPSAQYEAFADLNNATFIGNIQRANMQFWAFSLGSWDPVTGAVVADPNANLADVNLRKAIHMAIPWQEIGEALFSGLLVPGGNPMALQFAEFHDRSLNFNRYDPAGANRLLDEAGYTRRNAQGYRMKPDGSELVLTILWSPPATAAAETQQNTHLQAMRDIGLEVRLFEGRYHEWQQILTLINANGPYEFDIYPGGWSVGNNPNQASLWGPFSANNRSKYTSPAYIEIINRMNSAGMWDPDFSRQVYSDWQQYIYDNVPFKVSSWSVALNVVNHRVRGYNLTWPGNPNYDSVGQWHRIQLTADTGFVHQ
ncbi:MAG: ABC transporter substrate-binding protein [Treponema sp.]|nr:ABC transporter substrate-binding protein [Treponema sp.]